jgi:hypothetical protein
MISGFPFTIALMLILAAFYNYLTDSNCDIFSKRTSSSELCVQNLGCAATNGGLAYVHKIGRWMGY